jgi:mannitol/fructose-specific phosphotransferase system IIA component
MSRAVISLIFLFALGTVAQQSTDSLGAGVITYAQGGAFMVAAPPGWVTDRETGQKLGVCCVFYPAGSTWDDAETIMYTEIVEKNEQHANLKAFMAFDIEQFRMNNPELIFEDGDSVHWGAKTAVVRFFHGINKGSSEAVAYIDEPKIIAVLVMSAKSQKALDNSLPLFRNFVRSYAFMDVKFSQPSAANETEQHPQ